MRIIVALLVITAAACTNQTSPAPSVTEPSQTTTTTTVPASDQPLCLSGDLPFGAEGPIAALGRDVGDATILSGITFQRHEKCERTVLAFLNDSEAPASSLGPTGATVRAESGIIHLTLPGELKTSAVADTLLNGAIAQRAFVIRDSEGTLAVDIHVAHDNQVEARVFEVGSPIRLVVDVRVTEGDPLVLAAPSIGADVVLLTPAAGVGLYPLRVAGYVRPDVDSIRIRFGDGDTVLNERSVVTASDRDVWKAFDVRLVDGPSGSVDLYVGPVDAFEAPINGVTVPLELP